MITRNEYTSMNESIVVILILHEMMMMIIMENNFVVAHVFLIPYFHILFDLNIIYLQLQFFDENSLYEKGK